MTIAFSKYIDITSAVGGAGGVPTRELIGRIMTVNPLLPPNSYLEFDTLAAVGTYFGTSSEEYARAALYFGFVSKAITNPQALSYGRWTDASVAPMIFGAEVGLLSAFQAISNGSFALTMGGVTLNVSSLNFAATPTVPSITGDTVAVLPTLQGVTNGSFGLNIGGVSYQVTGLNFSGALTFADIATLIQTGINAQGTPQYADAVVTYASSVFNFTGGVAGTAVITVSTGGTGTDISSMIGWYPEGGSPSTPPIWTDGTAGSAVASYAAIATMLQTAIQAGVGAQFTSATVTYSSTTSAFNLVGGSAVVAAISVAPTGTGTDISTLMGWAPEGVAGTLPVWADGEVTETITDVLTTQDELSDNFGSFIFTDSSALDQDEIVEAATWTAAQNVKYQFYYPNVLANVPANITATAGLAGTGPVFDPDIAGQYPEMMPMMIMAATDYTKRNATQNYMFQQFPSLTPSVSDTTTSNSYDVIRLNYLGVTQNAGAQIAFFQRGLLQGGLTDPVDMNTYANEQWFKSAMGAALMNLLLALGKVSANNTGRNQVMTILQQAIQQALFNGTISAGKTLSNTQIASITQITGDPNAWRQVQNLGWWADCNIASEITVDSRTEFSAEYLVVYSKDDVVRSINGTHDLI